MSNECLLIYINIVLKNSLEIHIRKGKKIPQTR